MWLHLSNDISKTASKINNTILVIKKRFITEILYLVLEDKIVSARIENVQKIMYSIAQPDILCLWW